jgi:hypothetical protein
MENKIIKAGTKIVIGVFAGYCGTDSMNAYITSEDYTEEELSDIAWQEGLNHAESYGIYPPDDENESESGDEMGDQYSDNIEGWWELYNEKEHSGKCMFGYQREVHFQSL